MFVDTCEVYFNVIRSINNAVDVNLLQTQIHTVNAVKVAAHTRNKEKNKTLAIVTLSNIHKWLKNFGKMRECECIQYSTSIHRS